MQDIDDTATRDGGRPGTPTSTRPPCRLRCEMETGVLDVICDPPAGEALPFGFGERVNPRRAFLFVSRVLGRHVPVRPSQMRQAFTALADQIPADLPGPVLMTGMAETAVGLGAGVHDAYLARTGRHDVLFLSTTRAPLAGSVMAEFREEHSHASAHRLYSPQHAADRALLDTARSLVMVDDEASTGTTFTNLQAALSTVLPGGFDGVHTAVLTDWRGRLPAAPGTQAALLYGRFTWTPHGDAPRRTLPDADRPRSTDIQPLLRDDDGRLGRSLRSSLAHPAELREKLQGLQGTVLVLGTGEHVWEPFLIAEALERDGCDVRFAATTRSPILPGHEIRCGLTFNDHEGLGISNYLYNVDPAAVAQTVLCVDTALAALDPRLLASLRPHVLESEQLHGWPALAGRYRYADRAAGFDLDTVHG